MLRYMMMILLLAGACSVAGAQDYRLGPGDQVKIAVFGEADLSPEVRVDEAGRIAYPFLGTLRAAGLTTEQLRQRIFDGLKGDYLIDPKVSVSMAGYRPFYVNGAVRAPGDFAFEPGMTVRKALSLAGGTTDRASLKKIFLVQEGSTEANELRVELDQPIGPGDILTVKEAFF
ncbi:MAG: polysaccharide biosynthesis/export family protein [Pseudomonadota bacterium]